MKQRLRELDIQIQTEVHSARREVEIYRSRMQSASGLGDAQASLEAEVSAAQKELVSDFERSKENLKKFFVTQKNENQRLHVQIKQMKQENCGLQQSMIALTRRISDLEQEMGY